MTLLDAGIQLFINLTEVGEAAPYADWLGERAYHLRLPIPDFGAPASSMMALILDWLDEAMAASWRVYIHCLAGLGRTGTVIGCYLVRHGLTGPQALEKLTLLRAHSTYATSSSPETDEQRRLVLHWPVGG